MSKSWWRERSGVDDTTATFTEMEDNKCKDTAQRHLSWCYLTTVYRNISLCNHYKTLSDMRRLPGRAWFVSSTARGHADAVYAQRTMTDMLGPLRLSSLKWHNSVTPSYAQQSAVHSLYRPYKLLYRPKSTCNSRCDRRPTFTFPSVITYTRRPIRYKRTSGVFKGGGIGRCPPPLSRP